MAATSRRRPSDVPPWVPPMLAKPDSGRLPSGPHLSYDDKLDGYRCCARVAADGTVVLNSRNGRDFTDEFAVLIKPLAQLFDGRAGVLDGEIVAYNAHGEVDFGLLQERRGRYQRHRRTMRRGEPAEGDVDVRFMAFDLLRLGRRDMLGQPHEERRSQLARLPMPDPYRVGLVRSVTYEHLCTERLTPETLLQRTAAAGYEGLVAKVRTSTYQPGARSDVWLKHPLTAKTDVLICAFRPGKGGLTGSLGGLLLGAHDPATGDLMYIGDVGTGLTMAQRAELLAQLRPLERSTHPFAEAPPREEVTGARWVEPRLIGEVEYRKFSRTGRLRHAAWRGLRRDVDAASVVAPDSTERALPRSVPPPAAAPARTAAVAPDTEVAQRITVQINDKRVTLSNLDKVLYPADGYTKGEVINYFTRIAHVMLPHLRDRPITAVRWPDGVEGQSWFAKNTPAGAPHWLRTVRLSHAGSRGSGEPVDYPLVTDLASLVWLANLAALELHVPQWTVDRQGQPQLPDRLVFDLDPGEGASIVECCRVAERLHDLLVADGLTVVATTSGSKGMQLYSPIAAEQPDAPSAYAKRLAQQLARETPDAVTAVMAKARREGRLFIDWSQNNPAKTTIAPYSLRGRARRTVATPITWDEIRSCRDASRLIFTADEVLTRVQRFGDLLADLLTASAALPELPRP